MTNWKATGNDSNKPEWRPKKRTNQGYEQIFVALCHLAWVTALGCTDWALSDRGNNEGDTGGTRGWVTPSSSSYQSWTQEGRQLNTLVGAHITNDSLRGVDSGCQLRVMSSVMGAKSPANTHTPAISSCYTHTNIIRAWLVVKVKKGCIFCLYEYL